MPKIEIKMFPCLSDNYGFLVHDTASGQTASIDTPDPDEIMRQADAAGWTLTHIFNTHWHPDHTGGNLAIKKAKSVTIIGPKAESAKIPGLDIALGEGDIAKLGDSIATIYDTPAHTAGHIAYHFQNDKALFVGDTLFTLGCGRLFEGTAAQMWAAMERFAALDPDTQVYCAHEYTLANAAFAQTIETQNADLQAAIQAAKQTREKGLPTVPTTVKAERATNPFMRADQPQMRDILDMPGASNEDILGEIRRRKDAF